MDLSKEQRQRKEFCEILFELATKQEMLQDAYTRSSMYKRLEALYYSHQKEERFRHFYSDIFTVLTQIQQEPDRGDINILGQNLSVIRAGYNPQNHDEAGNKIDISDSIQKLYDHVSLDIARILYSDAGDRKISGEETIAEIQLQLKQINIDVKNTAEAQKIVEADLNKQQKEYVAILGIFAAVVLAFTGGIAFSTSVLENINSVSPYRIVIVALIIGLILINIIFGLFYYIDILVNGKAKKSVKPLWISNIIIIVLLTITIISWAFGAVEYRNKKILNQNQDITSVKEEIPNNSTEKTRPYLRFENR